MQSRIQGLNSIPTGKLGKKNRKKINGQSRGFFVRVKH